ncbi:MAG: DUF3991 and toprim domain-containing protein [Oscillospiraceae bacterium]|jgi:hypothetical protein|nr:DUF3991 and toprim domain-containing protein [Oscillospiraceae bacterium]
MINNRLIEQAKNADFIAFLEKYHGFTFTRKGGAYRCNEHTSLAVKNDRRSWYWHSHNLGGFGAVDYLVKAERMTFRAAVAVITGATPPATATRFDPEQPKSLILPEKRGIPLRLLNYLRNERGIDSEIINWLRQKEMLYEDRRGNIVFVGFDEQGKARFASLRGTHGNTPFRGDCAGSDKRYGFIMAANAPTERLYIFESPIDAMSHASLVNAATGGTGTWKTDTRLSLAGTSDAALNFFLNQHKEIKSLVFCLDNDKPGRDAALILGREYAFKRYTVFNEPPHGKDYNEDLKALRAQNRAIIQRRNGGGGICERDR